MNDLAINIFSLLTLLYGPFSYYLCSWLGYLVGGGWFSTRYHAVSLLPTLYFSLSCYLVWELTVFLLLTLLGLHEGPLY